MSALGDMIRRMGAAGASAESIAIAAETLEASAAPNTTAKQARNARYYQARKTRKASESATETVLIKTPTETTENALKRLNSVASRVRDNLPRLVISGKKEQERERGSPNGSRLPQDWGPITLVDPSIPKADCLAIEAELDKFRDYWRAVPGAKGRKLDWDATWRNWVRRAAENGHGRQPPEHQSKQADNLAAAERGARLASQYRSGRQNGG